ncbi:MAG: hypothetical protein PSV23_15725 [Brevundimonas sp.]|uniref:hypothetical protein n=1 Tax=Brevundimonas sp. TaxID=1871086 RepID=UPI002489BF8C|nr:hypothetical protein [Brevundimonas sp.]MDI1328242.1 hypothetical protein [Brevundimonas sp.]
MSVLSSPNGSPERVWSLVAGLDALGGRTERALLDGLFNPGYLVDGESNKVKDSLANDTYGAASSLGLLQLNGKEVVLAPELLSRSAMEMADVVYDELCGRAAGDTDAPLLDSYAWVAIEADRLQDLAWLFDLKGSEVADRINTVLVEEGASGSAMNPTKWVAWRRWMAFLGLSASLPFASAQDYLDPSRRLAREIVREAIEPGQRLSAPVFLEIIARRLPFLDGGRLFTRLSNQTNHTPAPRRISPLLSIALHGLHQQGLVQLLVSGDSAGVYKLFETEGDGPVAFDAVMIGEETR